MKPLYNVINEKLKLDGKIKFSTSYRSKYSDSKKNIVKFKKFFTDLEEMAGLKIVLGVANKDRFYEYFLYKIRLEEPDEIIFNMDHKPKSWKAVLKNMFHPSELDLLDDDEFKIQFKKANYILAFKNLELSDIVKLEKLGFYDPNDSESANNFINNYYNLILLNSEKDLKYKIENNKEIIEEYECKRSILDYLQRNKWNVFITLEELCNNIDEIYNFFFN